MTTGNAMKEQEHALSQKWSESLHKHRAYHRLSRLTVYVWLLNRIAIHIPLHLFHPGQAWFLCGDSVFGTVQESQKSDGALVGNQACGACPALISMRSSPLVLVWSWSSALWQARTDSQYPSLSNCGEQFKIYLIDSDIERYFWPQYERGKGPFGIIEEGKRQKKRQRSSLLFWGKNLFNFLPG